MPDELLVLGSASGCPTKRRFASAYALRVAGKSFLIDCGAPVTTLLPRYEVDPAEIEAIFLSHWHFDHVAGLGLFLGQRRQHPHPLAIYGPKGSRGKIRRLLNDSFILSDQVGFELAITNIKPGKVYQKGLLKVTFFKTQHLEKARLKTNFGRRAIACGMIIEAPGWRILYSGDLRSPTELGPYIAGCDLLIHEMAHVKPAAVADFAAAAKVPRVLISHIGLAYDEAPQKIIDAFAGRYTGQLIVAEDGTRLPLAIDD